MWAKKEIVCKKCCNVHMLKFNCQNAQKDGDRVDENDAADPKPVDLGPATTLSQPQSQSSEMDKQNQNVLVESLGPNCLKVIDGFL